MKAVGDEATIRWVDDPPPSKGDVLETSTGRQYLVVEVRGRKVTCIVVRKNHTKPRALTPTVLMHWVSRRKKR